jgi:hypothetical protein
MKKAILYGLVLFGGWLISSCKKETSIEKGNNVAGNFVAQIDGAQWAAASNTQQATLIQGMINITGISSDNQEISITIADSVAGTYTLNQQSTSLAAYADIDSSDVYAFATNQGKDTTQAGGVVTITEIDPISKTMSGTFSFKVYRDMDGRQKTITAGMFNRLPYTTSLPSGSVSDTLTASIDGTAWAGKSIEASLNAGELSIVGSSSDGSQAVGLLLPSTATAGTYPLDGSNPSYVGVYTIVASGTAAGLVSTAGSVTIVENNTASSRISGSFEFTAKDPTGTSSASHAISSGVFSIYYGQ